MSKLLEVKNLKTSFFTTDGEVEAVSDVSYYVDQEEVIAIVGESGCGKSVTQMSIMQLVQTPPGKILSGEVLLEGDDLLKYPARSKEMLAVRGSKISMIFQEPMTSLNPVLTVGYQLTEMLRIHKKISKAEAFEQGVSLLEQVGIPDPVQRMKEYPFQMSGGIGVDPVVGGTVPEGFFIEGDDLFLGGADHRSAQPAVADEQAVVPFSAGCIQSDQMFHIVTAFRAILSGVSEVIVAQRKIKWKGIGTKKSCIFTENGFTLLRFQLRTRKKTFLFFCQEYAFFSVKSCNFLRIVN